MPRFDDAPWKYRRRSTRNGRRERRHNDEEPRMSWGIIASSVTGGAIAAAVGALIGATAARYHRDQQWLRDRRADGCAALLAEHTRIELELRTAHAHQRRPAVDWTSWHTSVTALTLTAPQEVTDAAVDLTETMATVERQVRADHGHNESWPPLRDMLMAAQMNFINAARLSLDRSQPPLRHYAGAHRQTARGPAARWTYGTGITGRRPTPTTSRAPVTVNEAVTASAANA
jgi:hypothetical protein